MTTPQIESLPRIDESHLRLATDVLTSCSACHHLVLLRWVVIQGEPISADASTAPWLRAGPTIYGQTYIGRAVKGEEFFSAACPNCSARGTIPVVLPVTNCN